jgi:adenosylcobinamide kinase/adenosylcobinamide-phosphate guanylyltransferase
LKKVILILGGARSGKSSLAQAMAKKIGEKVLFVATGAAGDEDMRRRIEKHRQDRPNSWQTLEAPNEIGNQITSNLGDAQVVILDCITLLVSNIFCRYDEKQFAGIPDEILEAGVTEEINGVIECLKKPAVTFIIVSNEVGLGIVPYNRMGRLYRDYLGRANQSLAGVADEVFLVVAGIPVRIK